MRKYFFAVLFLTIAVFLFLFGHHYCAAQTADSTIMHNAGQDSAGAQASQISVMLDASATYEDSQAIAEKYGLVAQRSVNIVPKDGNVANATEAVNASGLFTNIAKGKISQGQGDMVSCIFAQTTATQEDIEKFFSANDNLEWNAKSLFGVSFRADCPSGNAKEIAAQINRDKPGHFASAMAFGM